MKPHFLIAASRDYFLPGTAGEQGKSFILEAHEEDAAVTTVQALRAQGWEVTLRRWTERQTFSVQTRRWKAGFVEMAA